MQRSIRKKRTPPIAAHLRSPREEPRGAQDRALSATAMIEAELSPAGEPVIGLFLHVAYMYVMSTFDEQIGHGEITPNLIGVLALVNRQPGTNQAELARLIGLERATVGEQVLRAVERGFLRRDPAPHDARSYSLHVTSRGAAMLAALRQRIPLHERAVAAKLTLEERKQLRALLDKLVYG
jgi:DNA-binding MarR family transcriptional regulator